MCVDCVKEEYPERDSICLDGGAYFLNFVCCSQCQKQDALEVVNKKFEDDSNEEVTTYDHVCGECQHVVASHVHRFKVDSNYQEYEMSCLLCGVGEDSRSVMPYDPRKHNLALC